MQTAAAVANGRSRPTAVLAVVGLLVGSAFAAPVVYIVWRNATLGADVMEVLFSTETLGPLWNTLVLATAVSVSTSVVGTALAWVVNRTDLPGRRIWRVLAPLPLVFPSFVGAAALITAFAPGGLAERLLAPFGISGLPELQGFWASWLVLTLFTYPFVYLPVAARLRALPASMEEAALLLGHRPGEVFRTVVLPQSTAAIVAGALLVFLYTLSDFGVVQLMRYDTLTREIFLNQPFRLDRAFALALILAALAIAVVAIERPYSRRALDNLAGRSSDPRRVALGRWRWPSVVLVTVFLANALLAPVLALGWWVWRGLRGDGMGNRLATDLGDLVAPTISTALVSLAAAAAAVVVVLPVAYLTTRHRGTSGSIANAFVVGGFALPGIAIALSLAFWAIRAPVLNVFYQTIPLLIFAYVVHFGAQSMRASQVAVSGISQRHEDAARMLGAGRWRRLATIELPIMRPGLAAGAGLVLLSTMKELPATLLLAPSGFETLATRTWNALSDGFWTEVGMASLVLVALSGALSWFLVVRRSDALG